MKEETYKCDGCGKVKGQSNHWFVASIAQSSEKLDGIIVIKSFRWFVQNVPNDRSWYHYCGHECLFKSISPVLPS